MHRLPSILLCLLLSLAGAAPLGAAEDGGEDPPAAEEKDGEEGGEEGEMDDLMGIVNEAYKAARRQARKGSLSDDLPQLAADAAAAAERVAEFDPPIIAEQPEEDREEWRAEYREKMAAVAETMHALREAAESGDVDAVGEIAKKLRGMKADGHEKFDP